MMGEEMMYEKVALFSEFINAFMRFNDLDDDRFMESMISGAFSRIMARLIAEVPDIFEEVEVSELTNVRDLAERVNQVLGSVDTKLGEAIVMDELSGASEFLMENWGVGLDEERKAELEVLLTKFKS